jgi:signal transduction histidine kinase
MKGIVDQHVILAPRETDCFLAESARVLASSLEFEETLAALAQLAVRSLADFCIIDVVEHNGDLRRLQVAHSDPDRAALTGELLRFPIDRRYPHLSLEVLQTGRPVLVPDVTGAVLDQVAHNTEHRRIIEALQPRSVMAVPLLAHTQIVGVLLLGSATRTYDADDVAIAEKLALLAGLEVDNALHYQAARKAVEARDRVLGIVAHDLRNPLNTIMMSADLIRDLPLSREQRDMKIDMILRAAHRMDRLIQDLLDIARLEADRLLLEREHHAPEALAREAVELGAANAAMKSLRLDVDAPAAVPLISVDRDRILRVLTNIIDNAIKFTPSGGNILVRVEAEEGAVRFSVIDTGRGISPEDLTHLFEPFWQLRNTSDGAGLGLAIARGIVEAHGGVISVESTPGRGSTFWFTVPVVRAQGVDDRRSGVSDRRSEDTAPVADSEVTASRVVATTL